MFFAYVLYDLGNGIFNFGADIVRFGASLSGIYLLSNYLAFPIMDFGNRIIFMGSQVVGVGRAWENVYNEIRNGVTFPDILRQLAEWGGRIIDFIANYQHYIIDIVRSAFAGIDAVIHGTYSFILPHVLQIIYDRFPFAKDIVGFINNLLNTTIPNFTTLKSNPVQWILDRLTIYSQNLGRFLRDPDGYIKEKLYIFFPNLRLFLENPTDYIIEKLGEKLEIFAQRYLVRLIKIVENALNEIF